MTGAIVAGVMFVCAAIPEGMEAAQVEQIAGVYFYSVPVENLAEEPSWFNLIARAEGCVEVPDQFAQDHCFRGTYVDKEWEESEFSGIACAEGVCHND